jgi:hypothetical protein
MPTARAACRLAGGHSPHGRRRRHCTAGRLPSAAVRRDHRESNCLLTSNPTTSVLDAFARRRPLSSCHICPSETEWALHVSARKPCLTMPLRERRYAGLVISIFLIGPFLEALDPGLQRARNCGCPTMHSAPLYLCHRSSHVRLGASHLSLRVRPSHRCKRLPVFLSFLSCAFFGPHESHGSHSVHPCVWSFKQKHAWHQVEQKGLTQCLCV